MRPRLPDLADAAPIAISAIAALACLVTMSGHLFPDSVNFLAEAPMVGERARTFQRINPAYPCVFTLVYYTVSAPWRVFALCAINQLANVVLTASVVAIGRWSDRVVEGRVVAWAVALYAPAYWFAQTSQQESIYAAATGVGIAFGVLALRTGSVWPALAAGLFAGFAPAQRSVGIVVGIVLAGAILCVRSSIDRGGVVLDLPRRLRLLAALGLSAAVVLGLFVVKNAYQFDHTKLVEGRGIHLFGRVSVVDQQLADTPETQRLLDLAARAGVADVMVPNGGWVLHARLVLDLGLDPDEADALLEKVAVQALLDDPVRTFALTWSAAAEMTDFAEPRSHVLRHALRPERFEHQNRMLDLVWGDDSQLAYARREFPPYAGITGLGWWFDVQAVWGLVSAALFRGPWTMWVLLALGIYGLVRRTSVAFLSAGLASAQILAAAVGDQPYPRYWEPSVWAYAVALAWAIGDAVRAIRARGAVVPNRDQDECGQSSATRSVGSP